jgi:hypothetical protein
VKVIRAIAFANGTACPHAGQFVERADFEAHNGQGRMAFTDDIRKALKFPTAGDAIQFWQTTSKGYPRRPDGKPNRPLTALTVQIEDARP